MLILIVAIMCQDLSVNVQYLDAPKKRVDVLEINGYDVTGREQGADSQAVAVVTAQTSLPKIQVKSRTTTPVQLETGQYVISDPGKHWVRVTAYGIVDGEMYFEDAEELIEIKATEKALQNDLLQIAKDPPRQKLTYQKPVIRMERPVTRSERPIARSERPPISLHPTRFVSQNCGPSG